MAKPNWMVLVSIFFVAFVISVSLINLSNSSKPAADGSSFEYSVSGCGGQREQTRSAGSPLSSPSITARDGSIFVEHTLAYYCCSEITVREEVSGSKIVLTEENIGERCRCICDSEVRAEVSGISSGEYHISIYGVKDKNTEPKLLYEKEVEVK